MTISASLGSSDYWAMGGIAIKPVGSMGADPDAGGSKVLAAYKAAPPVRLKAAPRLYVRPRSSLTLTRDPGVVA